MIMAMKYNKLVVFTGAFLALAVMTILSAIGGKVVFSFLPKIYTDIIVTLLFFYFGIKLIYEAYTEEEEEGENEELKEVIILLINLGRTGSQGDGGKIDQKITTGAGNRTRDRAWRQNGSEQEEESGDSGQDDLDPGIYHDIFGRVGRQISDRNNRIGCFLQLVHGECGCAFGSFLMYRRSRAIGRVDQHKSEWEASPLCRRNCVHIERCGDVVDDV